MEEENSEFGVCVCVLNKKQSEAEIVSLSKC